VTEAGRPTNRAIAVERTLFLNRLTCRNEKMCRCGIRIVYAPVVERVLLERPYVELVRRAPSRAASACSRRGSTLPFVTGPPRPQLAVPRGGLPSDEASKLSRASKRHVTALRAFQREQRADLSVSVSTFPPPKPQPLESIRPTFPRCLHTNVRLVFSGALDLRHSTAPSRKSIALRARYIVSGGVGGPFSPSAPRATTSATCVSTIGNLRAQSARSHACLPAACRRPAKNRRPRGPRRITSALVSNAWGPASTFCPCSTRRWCTGRQCGIAVFAPAGGHLSRVWLERSRPWRRIELLIARVRCLVQSETISIRLRHPCRVPLWLRSSPLVQR